MNVVLHECAGKILQTRKIENFITKTFIDDVRMSIVRNEKYVVVILKLLAGTSDLESHCKLKYLNSIKKKLFQQNLIYLKLEISLEFVYAHNS